MHCFYLQKLQGTRSVDPKKGLKYFSNNYKNELTKIVKYYLVIYMY